MDRKAILREAAEESLLREADRRRFLYVDVEALLDPGFLSHTVEVEETNFTLRTMLPSDLHNLLPRTQNSRGYDWKRWYLCHSVRMIGGYIIEDRVNGPYHLFQTVRDLRLEYVEILFTCAMGLRNREDRASKITRAYCHENYSRGRWRLRGAPEGERNFIQDLWVAHNEAQDEFDADQRKWAHTRAIAGSMSHKAAKALRKSQDDWVKRNEDLGQRVIEEAVNWVIQGDKNEQKPLTVTLGGKTYDVPTVHSAQTVEDLQAEMDRAMRGEKDYHDVMVDQYKAFHRARLVEARKAREEAWTKATEGGGEVGVTGTSEMVGYTPDQLAELNPDLLKHKPTTRRDSTHPSREVFDRYLTSDEQVGWIGTGGMPESAKAAPAPKKPSDDGGSLQERVARRKPRLKS